MRILRFVILFLFLGVSASAQEFIHRPPIYIVNGERWSEERVKAIDPEDIVSNRMLPADEQSVAKYGQDASNGVILITLRWDTPARFEWEGRSVRFSDYIAQQVKWVYPANPVARVVIALSIKADGSVVVGEVLEATDKRLLKRVQKALAAPPKWIPAMKDGKGVESEYTLRLTLPKGRQMPRERTLPVVVGGL